MEHLQGYDSDSDTDTSDTSSTPAISTAAPTELLAKYHIKPAFKIIHTMKASKFWTTFLYIEYRPTQHLRHQWTHYLRAAGLDTLVEPLYFTALGSPNPLHVSLSENIQFHERDKRQEYIDNLTTALTDTEPFQLRFASVPKWLGLYLVLPVERNKALQDLIDRIAAVHSRLGVPYSKDFFQAQAHMSIAKWKTHPRDTSVPPFTALPTVECDGIRYDLDRSSMKLPFHQAAEHKFDDARQRQ